MNAVADYGPEGQHQWYGMSSQLGRKRTAVYEVRADELVYLSDLPGASGTSFPGVVIKDGDLSIRYDTHDTDKDLPWLIGLLLPRDIRMAKVGLANLVPLATQAGKYQDT